MTHEQAYAKAVAMGFVGLFAERIADAIIDAVKAEREACAAIADRWAEVYISSANIAAKIRQRAGQ